MPDFTFWELMRTFFIAKRTFLWQYDQYEKKVISWSKKLGVPREVLKLTADEVSELLDLKALEMLRDDYLVSLKEMSHGMFRTMDSTDSFDKYVSNIFHEVSILKEEHYSLKSFGPNAQGGNGDEQSLLEEAHEFFPRRVRKIRSLFESARQRIEELLPHQVNDRILTRSAYIFGRDVLKGFYKGPLEGFYWKMYPEGGPAEGYFYAGRSFFDSGFYDLALEAVNKARKFLNRRGLKIDRKRLGEDMDRMIKDIRIRQA